MKNGKRVLLLLIITSAMLINACGTDKSGGKEGGEKGIDMVVMETNLGRIEIELNREKAPISVENFLRYINEGFYDGTIFHRVISTFMIQGGGFTVDGIKKETHEPIQNEAANGLQNVRGSIAMARTSEINSATAQFFINVVDNAFLDHQDESVRRFGYAVFGKVTQGMDVVDKIKSVPVGVGPMGMENWPTDPVVIQKVYVKNKP